ncbi:MAG: uracil-xanthine permease family protein [Candidatus Dormibacterales bacterium]
MSSTVAGAERGVLYPEDRLPWGKTILMGIQHVMAMFGATVLVPLILGFNPNTVIFFSGVGTLIFLIVTNRKVPSYLGSSFSFIGSVLAIQGGVGVHQGLAFAGIVVAGVVYLIIGIIVYFAGVNVIRFFMPPVVTGTVVAVIGIALSGTAWADFKGDLVTATVTALAAVLASVYLRGFPRLLPILIGVIVGYLVAVLDGALGGPCAALKATCHVNWSLVTSAGWVGYPKLSFPDFSQFGRSVSLFWFIPIVLVAENTGHVYAISGMMKRDLTGYLGRTFIGDAIATIVAGIFGGAGETTYAENIGVLGITRVFSISVFAVAAVVAILLGFIPKFGGLVDSIPTSVLGGIEVYLFGLIAVIGGKIWVDGRVDFSKRGNLGVAAIPLILAAGGASISYGSFALNNLGIGALSAIILYQILRPGQRGDEEEDKQPQESPATQPS